MARTKFSARGTTSGLSPKVHKANGIETPNLEHIPELKKIQTLLSSKVKSPYGRYEIDYAATARSTCKGCSQSFGDFVKFGVRKKSKTFDGDVVSWYHPQCTPSYYLLSIYTTPELLRKCRLRDALKLLTLAQEKLPNDDELDSIKGIISQLKNLYLQAASASFKMIRKPFNMDDLERSLYVWAWFDILSKMNLKPKTLKEILQYNNYRTSGMQHDLTVRLAHAIMYGILPTCPLCKNNELEFSYPNAKFKCLGSTDWGFCTFEEKEIITTGFQLPEFKPEATYERFAIDFKNRDLHLQQKFNSQLALIAEDCEKENASLPNSGVVAGAALGSSGIFSGLEIMILGELSKPSHHYRKAIQQHGGKFGFSLENCTHAITSADYYFDASNALQRKIIADHGVTPVPESYLWDCISENCELCDFSYNLDFSVNEYTDETLKSRGMATKAQLQKFTEAQQRAVSSELPKRESYFVFQDEKDNSLYNATLTLTDITTNLNRFYTLQVLGRTDLNKCHLFLVWGRVGEVGSNTLITFNTFEDAVNEFSVRYQSKTGQNWTDRSIFVKQPGKYMLLEFLENNEEDEEENRRVLEDLQNYFVKHITDGSPNTKKMAEMFFHLQNVLESSNDFDTKGMSTSKISKSQLIEAQKTLLDIERMFESSECVSRTHTLLSLSNKFYSHVPLKMKNQSVISTKEMLKEKMTIVNSLLDTEKSMEVIDQGKSLIYSQQTKLKLSMVKDFETVNLIRQVVNDTKQTMALDIVDIFRVESPVPQPTGKCKLLWHGSRASNFLGILFNGLSIAPKEAPHSGYMFGKGLYFSDMVSKAALYCHGSKQSPYIICALYRVEMNNPKRCYQAEYIEPHFLKSEGFDSVIGVGNMTLSGTNRHAGADIASGAVNLTSNSSLAENEYIVYSTEKAVPVMLVLMKLKY